MSRASNNSAANRSSARNTASRKAASRKSSSDGPTLRERMSQDLQLRGMAQRTHDGYLREVRKLACYYNASPDTLSERQVTDYLLHLINDCKFAAGTLSVAYSGIKFFYTFTEPRQWNVLNKLRLPKQKTLPSVLTIDEVHRLIGAVKQYRNAAYFWTVYTLGLRLEEGLNLQVGDIDSTRMMVHLHRGKGAKDRYLPLPKSTLAILRQHADGYLHLHAERMPTEHKRVLAAITRCRTAELGFLHYACRSCQRMHWVGRSCGNRHCPNCQSEKTQIWLAKRTAALLPRAQRCHGAVLPGDFHGARRTAGHRARQPAGLLPSDLRRRQRNDS